MRSETAPSAVTALVNGTPVMRACLAGAETPEPVVESAPDRMVFEVFGAGDPMGGRSVLPRRGVPA
jgi:hypothetical protein